MRKSVPNLLGRTALAALLAMGVAFPGGIALGETQEETTPPHRH